MSRHQLPTKKPAIIITVENGRITVKVNTSFNPRQLFFVLVGVVLIIIVVASFVNGQTSATVIALLAQLLNAASQHGQK